MLSPSQTNSTPTTTTPTTPSSKRNIDTLAHDKSSLLSGSLIRKAIASAALIVILITGINFTKSSPSLRQVNDSSNDSVYGSSVFDFVNKALFEISGTIKPSKFLVGKISTYTQVEGYVTIQPALSGITLLQCQTQCNNYGKSSRYFETTLHS